MDECKDLMLPSVHSSVDSYTSWVGTLVRFSKSAMQMSENFSASVSDNTAFCGVTSVWSARVPLTSLSFSSYLLAFLPWLFLLSFFNSEWDRSRESCFILCSIWYLLKVAFHRESSLLFTWVVPHVTSASTTLSGSRASVRSEMMFLISRIALK